MASDFQRIKISGIFAAMDSDGDGRLQRSDFEALADRWAALRGPGDHATVLSAVMLGWWSALTGEAGAPDGVTIDDVLATVDRLPTMPGAVTATAEAMFEAVDSNGDGGISAAEYNQMIEAWRGGPADTAEVFALLDLDHDGVLSRDEFTAHWFEFWAGDDPTAPGRSVFGLLSPA